MPHCLIEAASEVAEYIAPQALVQLVHDQAAGTGLFQPGEVKVRLSLYEHHCVGGEARPFVHLIFYLLAGRSDDDKRAVAAHRAGAGAAPAAGAGDLPGRTRHSP